MSAFAPPELSRRGPGTYSPALWLSRDPRQGRQLDRIAPPPMVSVPAGDAHNGHLMGIPEVRCAAGDIRTQELEISRGEPCGRARWLTTSTWGRRSGRGDEGRRAAQPSGPKAPGVRRFRTILPGRTLPLPPPVGAEGLEPPTFWLETVVGSTLC